MRILFNFVITAILLSSVTFERLIAQQEVSIHKLHRDLYGQNLEEPEKLQKVSEIIPLQNTKSDLSAAVFGFLPDWEYISGSHKYLRYDLLTHIACFDFGVDKDGNISDPSGWPWTDLINDAHLNGVKVILTAVKFGSGSASNAEMHNLLTDSAAIENFYSQVVAKMKLYKMDGVNIDFETYAAADEGTVTTNFMKGLTGRVHEEVPGSEVSFDTPIINWNGDYDLSGLVDAIDYAFIMGYAFYGSWSDNTGPGAPLTGGTNTISGAFTNSRDYGTIVQTMPEKLIIGYPYYGLHWKTTSDIAHAVTTSFESSPRYREAETQSMTYEKLWNAASSTPWYRWNNGVWNQVWYDDDSSLTLKYDLAISKNLMGVGMWALGYDGERQELWNLIDMKFGSGQIPPPIKPEAFNITAVNDNTLNLNFEYPRWAEGFEILISSDSEMFNQFGIGFDNDIEASPLAGDSVYYFKLNAFNSSGSSLETEVLAAVPASDENKVLIVYGFDRISGTNNTFDYIKRYGNPILVNGYKFNSASNEAVMNDFISLTDYDIVIWILGDESTANETFNIFEQVKVAEFLKNGGSLFVTGAEIGWDLSAQGGSSDKTFYESFLKAEYIADAPGGTSATYYSAEGIDGTIFEGLAGFSFDNGTHGTFDVDWPDAIKAQASAQNILKFGDVATTAGYAGISYEGVFEGGIKSGKLVHLSIPFETIYPVEVRIDILKRVLDFFAISTSINDEISSLPDDFELVGNYPNPFNPSTTIVFKAGSITGYTLQVYNTLGQLLSLEKGITITGSNKVEWNAENNIGNSLSSGIYLYRISFEEPGKILTGKMMLVR